MADALHFTGTAEADELLAAEPLALLIGFVPRPAGDGSDRVLRAAQAEAAARLGSTRRRSPPPIRSASSSSSARSPAPPLPELDGEARAGPVRGRRGGSTAATPSACGATRRTRKDLKKRIQALPGFGEMKVKALGVGARAGGSASRRRSRSFPTTRCSGTSTRRRRSQEYQAAKRAYKASMRAAAGLIELRTYRDGGQSAEDVAREVVAFLGAAERSLELALYDIRLHGEAAELVKAALARRRRAASTSACSTTSTTAARSRFRRPRRRRPSSSRRCRSRRARSRASPT